MLRKWRGSLLKNHYCSHTVSQTIYDSFKIPPKPEPKECTKLEPFELESLMRHEEEMQRKMEERRRMEMEEAQVRIFKTHPILKEDPIPVPEEVPRPPTHV